ncbi:TauD/TfdA family dioxygenase [Actinosynnema sp. NPDC050801]|jgi:alpha-ketoglutarate-dependent taurine dioxygenase|uniref:TauD/TfdA family dioxygenase n=1 Tax=unclassified Actinosynnema TaxID=2637065 RepID=UPI00340ADB4F
MRSDGTTVVRLGADASRTEVEEALGTSGVVLLHGLGIGTPEQFHAAVAEFGDPLTSYRGGNTPRSKVADGVFTSTEYPPEYEISLHNELSYASQWPRHLFFCCLVAAETGGATPVCDGRALLADLDPAVRARFTERGVTYRQHLHGGYGLGKSWQRTFETEERAEVERFLADADMTFEWTDDGGLRTAATRPATRTHPVTGEEVWFTQADQWHPSNLPPAEREALLELVDDEADLPHSVTYGDGQQIPVEDLDAVRVAAKKHEVALPWQQGDIMVVENMLALHGRQAYTGARRILVSMT